MICPLTWKRQFGSVGRQGSLNTQVTSPSGMVDMKSICEYRSRMLASMGRHCGISEVSVPRL